MGDDAAASKRALVGRELALELRGHLVSRDVRSLRIARVLLALFGVVVCARDEREEHCSSLHVLVKMNSSPFMSTFTIEPVV